MTRQPKPEPEATTALAALLQVVRDLRATVADLRIHIDKTLPEGPK